MSSYSYYNYPNPSSIGPYKPGYQDTFQNQMIGGGSQTTYGLNAFSGSGTTRFNASSMLPVNGAVVDKFDTPMQFKSNQYSQVLNYLMTRSLDMAQGLPYNLYAANGRDLIQLGSQNYNLLQPAYLPTQQAPQQQQQMAYAQPQQQAYYPQQAYAPQQPMGFYPQPVAYAPQSPTYYPQPVAYAQAQQQAHYPQQAYAPQQPMGYYPQPVAYSQAQQPMGYLQPVAYAPQRPTYY